MDIIEALEAAEIEYHQSESDDNEITINCPFCLEEGEPTQDTRFRLGINVVTGEMHCFNCNKGSRDAVYTFSEIQRVLDTGEIGKAQDRKKKKKAEKEKRVILPEDFKVLYPRPKDRWGKLAYDYVRSRKVTKRQIRKKKIGYSVLDGHMHHRIIFPIYWKGKLQGLVGRDFTGKQSPTYKNSVGSKALFNIPKTPQKSICLVEGVYDALAVEDACRKASLSIDSGATLGHTLTDKQLRMLRKYRTIILWYDPDEAGIEGLLHDGSKLRETFPRKKIKLIVPRTYYGKNDKDPSDLSRSTIEQRIRRAKLFTKAWERKLESWRAFDE